MKLNNPENKIWINNSKQWWYRPHHYDTCSTVVGQLTRNEKFPSCWNIGQEMKTLPLIHLGGSSLFRTTIQIVPMHRMCFHSFRSSKCIFNQSSEHKISQWILSEFLNSTIQMTRMKFPSVRKCSRQLIKGIFLSTMHNEDRQETRMRHSLHTLNRAMTTATKAMNPTLCSTAQHMPAT